MKFQQLRIWLTIMNQMSLDQHQQTIYTVSKTCKYSFDDKLN